MSARPIWRLTSPSSQSSTSVKRSSQMFSATFSTGGPARPWRSLSTRLAEKRDHDEEIRSAQRRYDESRS